MVKKKKRKKMIKKPKMKKSSYCNSSQSLNLFYTSAFQLKLKVLLSARPGLSAWFSIYLQTISPTIPSSLFLLCVCVYWVGRTSVFAGPFVYKTTGNHQQHRLLLQFLFFISLNFFCCICLDLCMFVCVCMGWWCMYLRCIYCA